MTATTGWCRPRPAALLAALLTTLIACGPARAVRGLLATGPMTSQGAPTPEEAEEGEPEESKAVVARRRTVAVRPTLHAKLAPASRHPFHDARPPRGDAPPRPGGQAFPLRC